MDPLKGQQAVTDAPAPFAAAPALANTQVQTERPVLSPEISQYYISVRSPGGNNASLFYHPMLLGAAEVHYSNSKTVNAIQQLTLLAAITDGPVSMDWSQATPLELSVADLESEPEAEA